MTPEQRAFVDGFLALAAEPTEAPAALSPAERAFVDGFVELAREALPQDDAATAFERVIMAGWEHLVWRLQGALTARLAALSPESHRMLRSLEDTPPLLEPLGCARDEVSHSRLLGWALRRPGPLGDALRAAWLRRFGREDLPVHGWAVINETPLGKQGRVDLVIEIPGHWLCYVEVKVDAMERDRQLVDYRRHLDAQCVARDLDGELVFLTVEGYASEEEVEHRPLSFLQVLLMWLPLAQGADHDAQYLRAWLTTIARSFYRVGGRGPLARWSYRQRRAALELFELMESGDE
jgi:hypothetical protein